MSSKNVRFVHLQNLYGKISGVTIAYFRDNDSLTYAFTKCNKKDRYEKAVGRKYSTAALGHFMLTGDETIGGVIYTHEVIKHISKCHEDVNFVISDHYLEQATVMDFKHAFLSEILTRLVLDKIDIYA